MWSWLWEQMPTAAVLKEWQTAVSALAGFVGVILTLLVNAWLGRRADNLTRRHDRLALRTVFRSELASLTDQATGIIEQVTEQLEKEDNKTALAIKVRLPTVIYDKNVDRLGILTNKEIETILETYLFLNVNSTRTRKLRSESSRAICRASKRRLTKRYRLLPPRSAKPPSFQNTLLRFFYNFPERGYALFLAARCVHSKLSRVFVGFEIFWHHDGEKPKICLVVEDSKIRRKVR
jgi:hypothetical protein